MFLVLISEIVQIPDRKEQQVVKSLRPGSHHRSVNGEIDPFPLFTFLCFLEDPMMID